MKKVQKYLNLFDLELLEKRKKKTLLSFLRIYLLNQFHTFNQLNIFCDIKMNNSWSLYYPEIAMVFVLLIPLLIYFYIFSTNIYSCNLIFYLLSRFVLCGWEFLSNKL